MPNTQPTSIDKLDASIDEFRRNRAQQRNQKRQHASRATNAKLKAEIKELKTENEKLEDMLDEALTHLKSLNAAYHGVVAHEETMKKCVQIVAKMIAGYPEFKEMAMSLEHACLQPR